MIAEETDLVADELTEELALARLIAWLTALEAGEGLVRAVLTALIALK